MPRQFERRYSNCTAEQLFDLVADVEKYPEFLPWLASCRIVRRERDEVWVEMVLGIGLLQQRFGSHARLDRPHAIEITSDEAPFDRFRQRWEFGTDADGRALVHYSYEFSLAVPILEHVSHAVLEHAVRATVDAFEQRAVEICGAEPVQPVPLTL